MKNIEAGFKDKPIDDSKADTVEVEVKWCDVTYQQRMAAIISHAMGSNTSTDTMKRIFDLTNPSVIFVTKVTKGNINQLLQCRIAPQSVEVFKIAYQAYGDDSTEELREMVAKELEDGQ